MEQLIAPQIDEPPGRGPELVLTTYPVPKSQRGIRRLVSPIAADIVAAYRGVTFPHPDHPDLNNLTRKKKDSAASGIRDARHLVVARDAATDEFAGLFAYTHHTEGDESGFANIIHLEGYPAPLSQTERDHVTNGLLLLRKNALFIETNELVVPKARRGQGVSEYMRTSVYNEHAKESGKTMVVLLGDMKDASPVGQREKSGGITYWAGQIIGAEDGSLPFGLTEREFRALSWAVFRAYREYHSASYSDSYMDAEGINVGGNVFELPVRMPKQVFNPAIMQGLTRLQQREQASGELCSAMGVTLLHV